MQNRHFNMLREEGQSTLHSFFSVEGEDKTADEVCDSDVVSIPDAESAVNEHTILLIKLICRIGLPIAALKSKDWIKFMDFLGSPSVISPRRLRSYLLIYAQEVKQKNYEALRHKFVSIITDGGTIADKEFYCVLMYADGKLYFAGAMQLDYTNHISIAKSLQPVIERITDNKGIPIAILTDNARNLKLAATDRSQPGPTIDTGLQVCSVQSLTRQNMLHISCSVHSANLILKDIEKEIPDFIDFKKGIKNLFAFLRHRNVRQKLKCHGVHEKVDRIQEIKWLTYYHAFIYVNKYHAEIGLVLADDSLKGCKHHPDFVEIPREWHKFLGALAHLGQFIVSIQGDATRLCQVFDHLLQLKVKWAENGDDISTTLSRLLARRFDSTADGLLAQVAYLFTPKGLTYFRKIFSEMGEDQEIDANFTRRFNLRDALMRKFLDIYRYFGFMHADSRVPPLFHRFLQYYELTTEPMKVQLDRLRQLNLTNQDMLIPWCDFCLTAQRLLELPASESVAERVISHMGILFPASRFSAKADLVDAQITVRMQEILDEHNSKTGLTTMI